VGVLLVQFLVCETWSGSSIILTSTFENILCSLKKNRNEVKYFYSQTRRYAQVVLQQETILKRVVFCCLVIYLKEKCELLKFIHVEIF